MKTKNKKNVENKFEYSLKLTSEEIKSIGGFEHLDLSDEDKLRDFVYNLSIVLYKAFENEGS